MDNQSPRSTSRTSRKVSDNELNIEQPKSTTSNRKVSDNQIWANKPQLPVDKKKFVKASTVANLNLK